MSRAFVAILLSALALDFAGSRADAGIAITFNDVPTLFNAAFEGTRGFEFTTSTDLTITALGFYDAGGDGLANSHEVGLFDVGTSALLASVVIPAGTAASPVGPDGFRFESLASPFLLHAGTYDIGATYSNGDADMAARHVDPRTPSIISYVGPRFNMSAGLSDPSSDSANAEGIFGPNFRFVSTTAVPEPSSIVSGMTAALLGLGAAWKRRRSRSEATPIRR